MKFINRTYCLLLGVIFFLITSCKDVWEEHNSQIVSTNNLMELIGSDASLSTFYNYIKKVGYDTILTSSRTYTVWAPTNEALSSLDASITGNDSILKVFIGNHIAYREYPTDKESDSDTITIKMVNSKNLKYIKGATSIEGSPLVSTNNLCKNGVLHTISSPIYPKNNILQYIKSNTDLTQLLDCFKWNYIIFDRSNSAKTGVDSLGNTVYDSVFIKKNVFLYDVSDVSNEDSTFTVFALNNTAFEHESEKLKSYVVDTTSDTVSLYYLHMAVCKDIVIRGKYNSYDEMPDTMVSTKGIKIPKNALSIVSSYNASNGMVYIVSSFDLPLKCKIPEVKIEGEDYYSVYGSSFTQISTGYFGIRERSWASGGEDVMANSSYHGVTYLSVKFVSPKLYNISYNIYRRTVNDFSSHVFRMKFAFNPDSLYNIKDTISLGTSTTAISYFVVNGSGSSDYSEIFVGTWDNKQYGKQNIFLVSDCVNTSYNSIELDYFKLVPVFN